ncbi:MAG TPA: DUF2239 family protein [Rhodoblastus sp.]|nr:DUF2239 family protein [Rhodoblastus sp.]
MTNQPTFVAFLGHSLIARGPAGAVARAAYAAQGETAPLLVFDAATSAPLDLDLRGTADEASARAEAGFAPQAPRGRGRPKLGVEAREVTLLPRHWDWLRAQPGGASVALRKLVEAASHDPRREAHQAARRAQEAAYKFMHGIGGDLPGFEEAARALFAKDGTAFAARIAGWPGDVRAHALALAEPAFAARTTQ